jgi:DNA-binding transcriptional MerR regulator/methylmalonyl-CoA mutase cobalamin-binding subunit
MSEGRQRTVLGRGSTAGKADDRDNGQRRKPQRRLLRAHDAFPLRTVAAMTGLTPDLIRAWEKRYRVVSPIRGARGARLYTATDIAHLRLLARVVGAGRAIGDVATLGRAELEQLAAQSTQSEREPEGAEAPASRELVVDRILERLRRFDDAGVARLLGDAVVGLGPRDFVHDVVAPLVQQVGACWASGTVSIAEEHLLTGTLRTLLASLMQGRLRHGPSLLLATPSGERHELGLLLVALLALDTGAGVVYLGVDLPAAEIVAAARRARARAVGLSVVTSDNHSRALQEIEAIQSGLPADVELWLGGVGATRAAAGMKGFRGLVLDHLKATETELARITAGAAYRP